MAFELARVEFGASVATDARGVWDPALGGLGLDAVATVERLDLTDLPGVREEIPEAAVASFRVRIEPLPGDRSAIAVSDMELRSETSLAVGSLRAIYGPPGFALESIDVRVDPLDLRLVEAFTGPLPYFGQLRGTIRGVAGDIGFDLVASLATSPFVDPFTVRLEGRVAFVDPGLVLRHLVARFEAVPLAALEPVVPGLPFQGPVTGVVRLDGPPDRAPVTLDVHLELGGGVVAVAGTLDLLGAVPAYDVTGRVAGVELQRVLAPAAPPVAVHAGFSLEGRGVSLETAHASLRVDGRFTGWEAQPRDTLALRLELAGGLVRAREVRLALGPIHLSATGDWRFANGAGGAIRYALVVESLEPLAPYLPPIGDRPVAFARGRVQAEGTVTGTLAEPELSGLVRVRDFRYDEWAAESLAGTYEIRLGPDVPRAVAALEGRGLRTPAGEFRTATLELEVAEPVFRLAIHGARPRDEGVVRVEADGTIAADGLHQVVVRTVELDLEDQRWRLPAPAQIDWLGPGTVRVADLRLERLDAPGLIRLEGIVAPVDQTELELELAALPVGDLQAMVGLDFGLEGELWLHGSLRGPADSPAMTLNFELRDGEIQDVQVTRLEGSLAYRDGEFVVAADALLADTAAVVVEGTLPVSVTLGVPPVFELDGGGPVRLTVRAHDFPMAALDPALAAVRDLEGRLDADILFAGTPADPELSGGLTLRGGEVTVAPLNQRYREIEGVAVLEAQQLRIERLTARSDGLARLSGVVRFDDITNPALDMVIELDRFRAQGVSGRRDAAVSGRLTVGGTAFLPSLAGAITVADGTVDLAALAGAPRFDGELIGLAEPWGQLAPMELDPIEPVERGVRIPGLDVTVGPDLWIQTDEVRAQLAGDLTIQMPGPDVMIFGMLTGERGTFNLRIGPATRRFEIVDATIQFFGTPGPDPAIDITAARLIHGPNRADFELRVRLSGTFSSPSVAFAAEDGTSIPEDEALNFLIFGRATATLADFPGAGLATTQGLYDALAFYGAFDWVSAALAEQFGAGIDYFQMQVRTGVADATPEVFFILGQEVVQDLFVTVTLPTTEFEARWAVTTEWRIDRQWTLEAGYEPPDIVMGIGGIGGRVLPFARDRDQQLFFSIRRRWTY